VLFVLLLGVTIFAVRLGPQAGERAVLLYHQRGCLNYTAPPDQVVFDSDPARVVKLANDPNFVISGGRAFRRSPEDWLALSRELPSGFSPPAALLFMHELRAPGCAPRLVVIEQGGNSANPEYFLVPGGFDHRVLEPAGIQHALNDVTGPCSGNTPLAPSSRSAFRIYAGQPDPADPSHFTIRFTADGVTRVVNGHLKADGSLDMRGLYGPP